jgi:ABC-type branched-subunit amino acid transport system substrate-binding protein
MRSRLNTGERRVLSGKCSIALALSVAGCNSLLGLDDLSVSNPGVDASMPEAGTGCLTNLECNADGGSDGNAYAICKKPERRCVPLLSPDCRTVTGDYKDERAIFIGSLFSLTGGQSGTNVPRQQSAILAVEEINKAGGVPRGTTSADARPLVLVSCDESVDLLRAGRHLVEELGVTAIVGPNTSQDVLDLSNRLTIESGVLTMTPSGLASSIADLLDNNLTWQMAPNDVQRGPMMIQQINALEAQLKAERHVDAIKLAVAYRDDALGTGTRVSLNPLVLNGKPLIDPTNLGMNVRIDRYDFSQLDQHGLIEQYVQFAPDIVVLAGTADIVPNVMLPLEQRWPDDKPRPVYLTIDPVKSADLLNAAAGSDDLRRRIRGTGTTPSPRSKATYDAFRVSYELRYPGNQANGSGLGPSYDTVYALAFAMAATREMPLTGQSVVTGLARLSGGATEVEVQSTQVLAGFQRLVAGQSISAIGTFGPLSWGSNGAVVGGTLEVWCIGVVAGKPGYQSSGLTLDLVSGRTAGEYTQCGP